jgi:hypothetical protein
MPRPLDHHRKLLDDLTRALGNLTSRLLAVAEGWRKLDQQQRELAELAPRGDLSQPRGRLLLRRPSRAPRHLSQMLRSHGIDPDRVRIDREFLAIETRCIHCDRWRRCRDWLASPETERGPAGFCPSIPAFELIRDY